jgi:hypothetical protein
MKDAKHKAITFIGTLRAKAFPKMEWKTLLAVACVVIILPLVYSCASTGFLMGKAKVTMLTDAYPPKEEHTTIDAYITTTPTQQYIELAKIICKDTSDEWCMQQIKKKARKIGADAIIILGKADSYGVGIPIGSFMYVENESYGMSAIAIKYKSSNK